MVISMGGGQLWKCLCRAMHVDLELSIHRSREFEKDLEFYLGGQWRSEVKMSPAAEKYCDHLLKISQQDPTLLIG